MPAVRGRLLRVGQREEGSLSALQPVRGTHDLLPEEMRRHLRVTEVARAAAELYGYQFMATPIFEFSEVFKRTLGETSDVVMKEMYSFAMKEGEEITLRPENTASVVRAMLSGGLLQNLPLKYFYAGPMFRHERPQKGRQRQFHQIGIELLGVAQPLGDVEVIACGARILERLGLLAGTRLELNTLGDMESRTTYRAALVEYFRDHIADLSEDSKDRLQRNPLRILDSKDPGDRRVVGGAPPFETFLTQAAQDFFAAVREGLDTLGIAYELTPHLVRGLDYYCHTAFEFKTDRLGAQDTIMGGGRYDGLVETMGGPPTPGRRLGRRDRAHGHAADRAGGTSAADCRRPDRRGGTARGPSLGRAAAPRGDRRRVGLWRQPEETSAAGQQARRAGCCHAGRGGDGAKRRDRP